jgi:hypothetical protein
VKISFCLISRRLPACGKNGKDIFMSNEKGLLWFLYSFQNKDAFFEQLTDPDKAKKQVGSLLGYVFILAFMYGLSMGSFNGPLQALTTAIKIPVLLTVTLLVCFPALFVIQTLLGSKLRLVQMTSIILVGIALMMSIIFSFIPIVVVFLFTGSNYYFMHLLHIGVFLVAGIFGMKMIVDALKFSCEKKNIYPQIGVVVFRFWILIFIFVGVQIAWNLQPYLGDSDRQFRLFRKHEGNFYTAVIYSIKQLAPGQDTANFAATRPYDRVTPEPAGGLDSLIKSAKERK